jgi:hypothetical protein
LSVGKIVFGGLMALLLLGQAQTPQRPPIGGFGSPPNAMTRNPAPSRNAAT